MTTLKQALLVVVAVLSAQAVFSGKTAFADTIVRQNGSELTDITITNARYDRVQYNANGQDLSLDGGQVAEIRRNSRGLASARKSFSGGKLSTALKNYNRAKDALKGWEKAEAMYYIGRVYQIAGQDDKAIDAYDEFVKEFREDKDWWVPHAVYALGELSLKKKRGKTAAKFFGDLEAFGATWSLRSKLGKGWALLSAGSHLEARRSFNEVQKGRNVPLAFQMESTVGRAEVMVAQKQFPEAIKELEKSLFNASKGVTVYNEWRARGTL
ncbi:MAG: tetratricopeptide repeat protein, partial [Planctomycetota bacterium]